MKDDNYVVIQGWMVNRLGLTGNELMTYALIYGFTQDGISEYSGSSAYLMEWLGTNRRATTFDVLKRLEEKGLIEEVGQRKFKTEIPHYRACTENVQAYTENVQGLNDKRTRLVRSKDKAYTESVPNNTIYNSKDNSKDITLTATTTTYSEVDSIPSESTDLDSTTIYDGAKLYGYVSENLKFMSPRNYEEMETYRDDLPDEVIMMAVDEACANGSRQWSYVRGVLNVWLEKDVKTVADASDVIRNHGKRGSGKSKDMMRSVKDGTYKGIGETVL